MKESRLLRWRFRIVYEGVVAATDEDEAIRAAQQERDAGLAPVIQVEPEDEGEGEHD
jgi:hypothetical protein